jgi:hypothetical protein
MPQDTTSREDRVSAAKTAEDHRDSAPMPGEAVEPELNALTSENLSVPADSARCDQPLISRNNLDFKKLFVIQNWHRPYAEALLEADPATLPALIAVAEREILARCFELSVSPVPMDEKLDLRHAVRALSRLKKDLRAGTRKHFAP